MPLIYHTPYMVLVKNHSAKHLHHSYQYANRSLLEPIGTFQNHAPSIKFSPSIYSPTIVLYDCRMTCKFQLYTMFHLQASSLKLLDGD